MYFPELASDNPVIRIPRRHINNSTYEWYPFSYTSDDNYVGRFESDDSDTQDWLFAGLNSDHGACVYAKTIWGNLRSGKIVFEHSDEVVLRSTEYPVFEVPVVEYDVPTLKMNGEPVLNNGPVAVLAGQQPFVITAEFPKWVTVESHEWTIDDNDAISFSDETVDSSDEHYIRYSRTVTLAPAYESGECSFSFGSYLHFPKMTDGRKEWYGIEGEDAKIEVSPVLIYDQEGNNLTKNESLSLTAGDRLVLEPQISGIIEVGNLRWSCDSDWQFNEQDNVWENIPHSSQNFEYEYNPESPYTLTLTVKNGAQGFDQIFLDIWLNGQDVSSAPAYSYQILVLM